MHSFSPHGKIDQAALNRKDDYLYRISLKALVRNELGHILVVKEAGRAAWDLPGGGMDHGEDIRSALARELHEEVRLTGDFDFTVIAVDDPAFLPNPNVLQVRLVFQVTPQTLPTKPGDDSDEIMYIDPILLKYSGSEVERKVYEYSQIGK